MNTDKFIIIIILLIGISSFAYSQNAEEETGVYNPILKRNLKKAEIFNSTVIDKKRGHFTAQDWREEIDNFWGAGLPTSEKLAIFDKAVGTLNSSYAAFQNLEVNLDSLVSLYRPEVENGVSRGRFAAIMNYISLAMNEAHTIIADIPINFGTRITSGVPLFVIGPWEDNSRFGAVLTPLPDSTLLVYRALPSQKLGLTPGDIILGYDGIPWKKLYRELLKAELPIYPNGAWGSTERSFTHAILGSAGLNWHLFDTLDVVKKITNDTLHLSTAPLYWQRGLIWGNEQLPVAGVPFPDFSTSNYVNWGIVSGTNIGYIYVASWSSDSKLQISSRFYNAIDSLMNVYETEGLILDFRYNGGGYMGVAHAGYTLLFRKNTFSVAFDIRADSSDHFSMKPHPTYTKKLFMIQADPDTYYDKPIAVLTGPGAISNGDFESWRMKLHPMARLFGKSSCGAYATSTLPSLGNDDWFFYLTYGNSYPVSSPGEYLVHTDLPIDEEVWLTQQGVLNGNDDVVGKAVDWIRSSTDVNDEIAPNGFSLNQNYPNPFNPTTTIEYSLPSNVSSLSGGGGGGLRAPMDRGDFSKVRLVIYDILGREVATLVDKQQKPGTYKVLFDASNLASGVYFCSLHYDDKSISRKMLLLK